MPTLCYKDRTVNAVLRNMALCCDSSMEEVCALLIFYAAQNVTFLPMFRDNLSISYSRVN